MTLKVYGHLYPSHEAALADALDAGFNEAAMNVIPLARGEEPPTAAAV